MVRAIISWSLHNRLIVLLGALALVVAGVHAVLNLERRGVPRSDAPAGRGHHPEPRGEPRGDGAAGRHPAGDGPQRDARPRPDLRSTSIAGLNDIKCQFTYGTDYWAARQEVINRIGFVDAPDGGHARPVALEPDRRDRPLRAGGARLHDQPAQGGAGLGPEPGPEAGPRRDRRDRLRRDGQAVSGPARPPPAQAIRRDDAAGRGRDRPLQRQRRRRRPDPRGASRTTSGPSASWAGASTRSTRPTLERASAIEAEKLDDIRDVVVATTPDGTPIYVRQVARVVVGHRPRLGLVGRGAEDDVVEGIVLMRKYEKSLPVAEAVAAKMRGDRAGAPPPQGDEDAGLQPADRPGPRDDAQRPAQPGRRHGAGGRRPLRLPGRPGQRGDRGR